MRKFKLIRQAVDEENNINNSRDQSETEGNIGLSLNFSPSANMANNDLQAEPAK